MSKKTKKVVKNVIAEDDELEVDNTVQEEKVQSEETKQKVEKKAQVIDEDFEDEEEITIEDRIINIEKKTNTTLVLMVITVLLVFITMLFTINNSNNSSTTSTEETETSTYSTDAFDVIKGTDIATESKGKTIVVMMGRQGCGYCAAYAPVLGLAQEDYDFVTKYIDLADIIDLEKGTITDEDSYNALMDLDAVSDYETYMEDNFGRTPLTLFIKDSKIIGTISGYVDSDELATQLETYGISKK